MLSKPEIESLVSDLWLNSPEPCWINFGHWLGGINVVHQQIID
jgi:hypothetical protein